MAYSYRYSPVHMCVLYYMALESIVLLVGRVTLFFWLTERWLIPSGSIGSGAFFLDTTEDII